VSNQAAAKAPASLIQRYLPGAAVLRGYQRSWLRGDLLAGVTVAAYLVPQVMAYAEVAGLPAIAGLWAAVGPLLAYAILGSSRQLSAGPESSTALMTATAVTALSAGDQQNYAETAAALALAVGAICLVCWLARLGFLANLLSHPVLIGYMAGIAVLMIISQLGKVTGIAVKGDTVLSELRSFFANLDQLHWPTLLVAASTFALLVTFDRLLPRWPGPLIAMAAAAAAVAVLNLDHLGVGTVGSIPRGLPPVSIPDFSSISLGTLLPAALGVTIVAYSDNIVTGRAFAARRHQVIDARQEFLGLGAANLLAGLFSGFPVSSSGSRTAIGDAMRSRTQLYSIVAAGIVLITMLFLGPALSTFPLAALGAVVVFAALRLIDFAELRRIARFRRSELFLALAATAAVLIFDVLYGIAVAVALSILDLLRRIARPHDGILGFVPGLAGMHDIDDYATGRQMPGLLVYRYDAPLFFANAEDFKHRALTSVDGVDPPVEWFLLNAEANTEIDLTAVDALEEVREKLADRGIVFALARVKFELREILASTGFLDRVGEDRVFMTLPTAVAAYQQWYKAGHGGKPPTIDR
jgi:sulfate permease, SulP family